MTRPQTPHRKSLYVLILASWLLLMVAPVSFGAGGGGGGGGGAGTSCTPSGDWEAYGFALPGDPVYGFAFADNNAKDFVGLAAKGNIIIGDYTDKPNTEDDFPGKVLPALTPGPGSLTQAYQVDSTDASLGYANASSVLCGGKSPCFDGNYGQYDGGRKLDSTQRRFYESSLSDTELTKLVEPKLLDPTQSVRIDAVLFTNHALAGLVSAKSLTINGSMVSRDDGLMFGHAFYIDHDIRLISAPSTKLALPFSIHRPKLVQWQECPPGGCTP